MRNKHITAEIIADSINEFGDRITTFIAVLPRIVLAEFNTHRMLSRNSSSSRAIPFKTMVEKVKSEPFIPIKWQKNHPGMQGTEYYTEDDCEETDTSNTHKTIDSLDYEWLGARDQAIYHATCLNKVYDVTKQFCNRLLEPFLYQTLIVTATEWENFFALRAHPAAEIHIADLAQKMLYAYNQSTPKELKAGDWHIPFGDKFDIQRLNALMPDSQPMLSREKAREIYNLNKIKIATARCARVSYLNYEGTDDYAKDIALYNRLSSMGHWSPFEHCAKSMSKEDKNLVGLKNSENLHIINGWSGNFKGFIQLRKTFVAENKSDRRVIKK